MRDQQPTNILIFDSGMGGLSVAQAIRQRLPHCQYTYLSDSDGFPYGIKSTEFLLSRMRDLLLPLIKKVKPNIVVIACNTASTVVLPYLREQISIPVIGVVPAIKPAAQISQTKHIGLLATPATIEREYTQTLIDEFAHDCTVTRVGSSRLVEIAEAKLAGNSIDINELQGIIAPLIESKSLDVIVLGCTHFPLVKAELQQAAIGYNGAWIDSGNAIANRVLDLLPLAQQNTPASLSDTSNTFYLSALPHNKAQLEQNLSAFGFEQLQNWPFFE